MNLSDPKHPWSRLVAAARTTRDQRDATAPFGFASRVAALAFDPERRAVSLFDVFAWRAVGISCLLAVLSVAVNYSHLASAAPAAPAASSEEELAGENPVDLLLTE